MENATRLLIKHNTIFVAVKELWLRFCWFQPLVIYLPHLDTLVHNFQ